MKRLRDVAIAALPALLLIAGCDQSKPSPTAVTAIVEVEKTVEVAVVPVGDGGIIEHPPLDPPMRAPRPRRLTVDQLAASLAVVAGKDSKGKAIVWTYSQVGKKANKPALLDNNLAPTLGKPDYVENMVEPRNPSPLHLKFIDDMARDVCAKMLAADTDRIAKGTADKDAVLARFAKLDDTKDKAAIRKNLRFIQLRFLSQYVAQDDVAATTRLEQVFEAAAAGAKTAKNQAKEGWAAVCVAVLTSPAFHIY
jgi:hypothetical protein